LLRAAADEAASVHVQRADAMRAAMDAMQVRVRVLCVCWWIDISFVTDSESNLLP
jgi:hypothetical protein